MWQRRFCASKFYFPISIIAINMLRQKLGKIDAAKGSKIKTMTQALVKTLVSSNGINVTALCLSSALYLENSDEMHLPSTIRCCAWHALAQFEI